MIHLAICDDDKEYMDLAEKQITDAACRLSLETDLVKTASLEELIGIAGSPGGRIDMLFLDIEFGDETSIETAKKISILQPGCDIVFLTNYLSYALDVYEIPHIYYVIKEELPERIGKVFAAFFAGENNAKLCVTAGVDTEIISLRDVIYIERMRLSCRLVMRGSEIRTTDKFTELSEKIRAVYMLRCHNSFIINLKHAAKYKSDSISMINGDIIPISRPYIRSVKDKFRVWQDVWM